MTDGAIRDLARLLRELRPRAHPVGYAWCALPAGATVPSGAIAWFREAEGTTLILPATDAQAEGLAIAFECAMITLEVHSALEAVGLTAAVASALAREGIPCNVVAALHHDHLFVPTDRAGDALRALERLSADARR